MRMPTGVFSVLQTLGPADWDRPITSFGQSPTGGRMPRLTDLHNFGATYIVIGHVCSKISLAKNYLNQVSPAL